MALIYVPSGKAREYSPLALNVYNGCDHGCSYCYVKMIKKSNECNKSVAERRNFLQALKKELSSHTPKEQILLSFMCDPYCNANNTLKITRETLIILNEYNCKVALLTKGGSRCLQDIDVFESFGSRIKIGATLTTLADNLSIRFEPKAALQSDRISALQILHKNKIKTFASMEPVLDHAHSIAILKATIGTIDQYKIGKMNYHEKDLPSKIDWAAFLYDAVTVMRTNGKDFYIKHDLQAFDVDKVLTAKEKDMNALNL